MERDQRGDIRQHAGGPAGRWLERLIDRTRSARQRALGRVQRRHYLLCAAAGGCQQRVRQQQPRPGLDQLSGQRGKPPLYGRALAAQEKRVDMPFDQPRGPGGVPGGYRVAHGVAGQAMLF